MFAAGPPKPEQFDQFRKEMDKLSPDQRDQLWDHMGQNMQRRMQKQVDDYFALPPDKRDDFLDKQIAEQEKWRKEMEKRQKENGGGPPGQRFRSGRPPRRARRRWTGRRPERLARHAKPTTQSDARQHLARPAARFSTYFSDLQKRRAALGLPTSPWGGGPGRR